MKNLTNPKLKVMQILPALNSGGVEKGTLELGQALVQLGHTSIVVSNGGKMVNQLEIEGSQHICLPVHKKSLSAFWQINKLARIIEHENPDIVHVRSRLPAWITHFALKRLPVKQRPIHVSTVHGFNSVNYYSEIMTQADKVIVVSESIKQYILKNYPRCPEDRLIKIYRGIEPNSWQYNHQASVDWFNKIYQEFPHLQNKRWLTLVGRVSELKGHHWLIEAVAQLKNHNQNQYKDLHIVFIGANKETKSHYFDDLQQTILKLDLTNHVTFTGQRSDIADWLSASALTFNLSKKPESFGRTTLEALSLGVPVIAWDKGGVSEILSALYPYGKVIDQDLSALITKIEQLLHQPTRPLHAYPFTLQAMTDNTISLYQQLLLNKSRMYQ